MRGKRRPKSKDEVLAERWMRQSRKDSARLVKTFAEALKSPRPEGDLVGEQTHFLRRIERLPDEVKGLAVRLYYSYELRRFVARKALGLRYVTIGSEAEPKDLAERRVVVSIEPGMTPSRLIFDGRGKVVTCLAPDMAVGSGTRVSYERFKELVAGFKGWQELQDHAHQAAEETDLVGLCLSIGMYGWLTPREVIATLAGVGPAAGPVVLGFVRNSLEMMARSLADTARPGPLDDSRIRIWFHATAQCAALLALLAEWGIEVKTDALLHFVFLCEPIVSLVLGACTAFWRPNDGIALLWKMGTEEERERPTYWWALMTYLGMDRRLRLRKGNAGGVVKTIEGILDTRLRKEEEAQRMRRVLGEPETELTRFNHDLIQLALGGRPDWGEDLAEDPDTLPPLRVEDLCLPENGLSLRVCRLLVQRLFAGAGRPLWHLFLPAAEISRWAERLGPLEQVRQGRFWPAIAEPPAPPPPVVTGLPGRNEPCPCGSGKKFKRCCLEKMEAGKEPAKSG